MKYYATLLKWRCFTKANIATLTGSDLSAKVLLTEYRKRGYVDQIRRGLWVALGLDDNQPVASRYEIATATSPTACVSHHSAFAYHGYVNQVSYEMCVTSSTRLNPFEYGGLNYRWLSPRINVGIDTPSPGVRITDLERTVLDSINDVDKTDGLEELLASLDMVPYLNPDKMTAYLGLFGKQVLYQKAGYLLSLFNDMLRLPESFFADCEARKGRSVSYLDADLRRADRAYDRRWQLVVPRKPLISLTQGVT